MMRSWGEQVGGRRTCILVLVCRVEVDVDGFLFGISYAYRVKPAKWCGEGSHDGQCRSYANGSVSVGWDGMVGRMVVCKEDGLG